MSPLHIEIFNPVKKEWMKIGGIHPTDPKGAISDNKPNGERDLYSLKCERDDSKSTISRSGFGVDIDLGKFKMAKMDTSKVEIVKELKDGESFEMEVKTDNMPERAKIRFVHKKGEY